MEFIWKMTEENWKNMVNDSYTDIYEELSDDFGFYGQLYVGDYCIEFHFDYFGESLDKAYTYIYQLFVDDGYGYEVDGTPYSLTDFYIDVPNANSFDSFKNICEREFAAGIGTMFEEKYANKKCEWKI